MKMSDNSKKNVVITLVCCAVAFVLLFAIVNIDAISAVFSSILSLISPILIGFAIAYILNPLLKLFEFKIYKKIKNKNLLRGLSIASTYVVAVLFVVAFFFCVVIENSL